MLAWVDVNIIFIVDTIESVRVLKTEFFPVRLEAGLNELLKDLKSEVCSAKDAAAVSESLRPLNRELCSVSPETRFPMLLVGF